MGKGVGVLGGRGSGGTGGGFHSIYALINTDGLTHTAHTHLFFTHTYTGSKTP